MSDLLLERLEQVRLAILKTHDENKDNIKASSSQKIDGLLISDIVNVSYVSGFTGSTALALVMPDNAYLLTDSRYTIRAKEECVHFDVRIPGFSQSAAGLLPEILSNYNKNTRIGFETSASFAQIESWKKAAGETVRWKPCSKIVEIQRLVKDEQEIGSIRKAVSITEEAFEDVKHLLIPSVTEKEFAAELDHAMRKRGADKASFETIVASGLFSARPHHTPTNRAFEAGDLVIIDWGAEIEGYCGDLTRTVLVAGAEPTEKQTDVHKVVLEAVQIATAAIRPGITGQEIDSIARDHIIASGYRDDCFGHSLGHSLGRIVHDGMTLSPNAASLVLKPGMITTVEPGIYIEGWGGVRIEEDVLVTETGSETLSSSTTALTRGA